MILAAMHGPPDDSDPDIPEGIRYDPDLAVHEPMEVPAGTTAPSPGRTSLLIFPLGLLALCLVVYVLFGLIADEGKSASDYLDSIRLGRADAWQAAHELSRLLATEDAVRRDPRILPRIIGLLEGSADADPRVRRYLILSLGRLEDARGVEPLIGALAEPDLQARHAGLSEEGL